MISAAAGGALWSADPTRSRDSRSCSAVIGSTQIQKLEPGLTNKVIVAYKTPLSGHVDPMLTTMALGESAAAAGATIIEGVGVDRIRRLPAPTSASSSAPATPCRYEVRADDGSLYHAKDVVLASGAWFGYLDNEQGVQVEVPVRPVKGQMWITEPLPLTTLKHVIYISESHTQWAKRSSLDLGADLDIPEFCTHNRDGEKVRGRGPRAPLNDSRTLLPPTRHSHCTCLGTCAHILKCA